MYYHICQPLDVIQRFALEGRMKDICIVHEDGTPITEKEVYELVREEKAKGREFFTGCDNVDSRGMCAGHERLEK